MDMTREPYAPPKLIRHGSLEELTQGGTKEAGEKASKPVGPA